MIAQDTKKPCPHGHNLIMNPNTDATDAPDLISSQTFTNDTDFATGSTLEQTFVGPDVTIVTTSRNEFIRFRITGSWVLTNAENRFILIAVQDNGVDVQSINSNQFDSNSNTFQGFTWTYDYFADPGSHTFRVRYRSLGSAATVVRAGFSVAYEHRTRDRLRVLIDATDPWTFSA